MKLHRDFATSKSIIYIQESKDRKPKQNENIKERKTNEVNHQVSKGLGP